MTDTPCSRCGGNGEVCTILCVMNDFMKCEPIKCPDCNGTGQQPQKDEDEFYPCGHQKSSGGIEQHECKD